MAVSDDANLTTISAAKAARLHIFASSCRYFTPPRPGSYRQPAKLRYTVKDRVHSHVLNRDHCLREVEQANPFL